MAHARARAGAPGCRSGSASSPSRSCSPSWPACSATRRSAVGQVPLLRHRRGRHRPGLGPRRHARRSARACSSASAATAWACTSSSSAAGGELPDFMTLERRREAAAGSGSRSAPVVRPADGGAAADGRGGGCSGSWCSASGSAAPYFAILTQATGAAFVTPARRPAGAHRRHQRPDQLHDVLRPRPRTTPATSGLYFVVAVGLLASCSCSPGSW